MIKKLIIAFSVVSAFQVQANDGDIYNQSTQKGQEIVRPSDINNIDKIQEIEDLMTKKSSMTPLMIGGEKLQETGDFKYYARLLEAYDYGDGVVSDYYSNICGASILSDRYILTAAHCVTDGTNVTTNKNNLKIIVKNFNQNDFHKAELKTIKNIYKHEDFDYNNYFSKDIAIIELEHPITDNVQSITLPSDQTEINYLLEDYYYLVGLGYDDNNYGTPDFVKKGKLKTSSDSDCSSAFYFFNPTNICVESGLVDYSNASSCRGDSGGPLSWLNPVSNKYEQIGLTSYGDAGCSIEGSSTYTEIYNYKDFIISKMTTPSNPLTYNENLTEVSWRSEGDINYVPSAEDTNGDGVVDENDLGGNGGNGGAAEEGSSGGSMGVFSLIGLGLLGLTRRRK